MILNYIIFGWFSVLFHDIILSSLLQSCSPRSLYSALCFPMSTFGWFSLYTVCLWISSLVIWKFLFFIRLLKRYVSFVTFFMLDWSQPLGCVSVVFVFVAWCLDFVSFSSDQQLICTDHYNVSATQPTSASHVANAENKAMTVSLDRKTSNSAKKFKFIKANWNHHWVAARWSQQYEGWFATMNNIYLLTTAAGFLYLAQSSDHLRLAWN